MQIIPRIPRLTETSFDGASTWFHQLHCKGLLFHPEDDPASIISIIDGEQMFSEHEASELRLVVSELENSIGHDAMIEAAYPIFMRAMDIQLTPDT